MAVNNLGPYRLNPRGEYSDSNIYRYFDHVTYNGSSYICIKYETISTNGSNTGFSGIKPVGDAASNDYWMPFAIKGDKGDSGDKYDPFITLRRNGDEPLIWNYNNSDKIIIPKDVSFDDWQPIVIENTYDGCCGMIVTENRNVILPANSEFAVDFDYVTLSSTQRYLYTFICMEEGEDQILIWNRTVIQKSGVGVQ